MQERPSAQIQKFESTSVNYSYSTNDYSAEAISGWFSHQLAKQLRINTEEIQPQDTIADFALDSLTAVKLMGKLSDWLNFELSSTMLYEHDNITALAQEISRIVSQGRELEENFLKITIAASFTAEPIEEALAFWIKKLLLKPQITFAPYNQIFQELFNPFSIISTNSKGINIILIRVEDWFRYEQTSLPLERIQQTIDEFLRALESIAGKATATYLVGICPHSHEWIRKLGLSDQIQSLDQYIQTSIERFTNVTLVDLRHPESYDMNNVFDPARDKLGHIPFTTSYFRVMGTVLARKIFSLLRTPNKVIVLDCDNTLWHGVCAEDGPVGIQLTKEYLALQQFMLKQQQQGKLLCLCSKNNAADVWAVFDHHPEMPLKKSHFVSSQINWQSKSDNLQTLAQELQLGLDSFIFVDDNPLECADVQSQLPTVLTVQLPQSQEILKYLEHHWAFDIKKVTQEDLQRSQMYVQNRQRTELLKQVGDFDRFIASLELVVDIHPLDKSELPRAAQLTERTNQFNATTIRRSEAELNQLLLAKDWRCFTVTVKDRFGDYGIVGLMITQWQPKALEVETFLLSCRVLGKRVEHQMMLYLARMAQDLELEHLQLLICPSDRNSPLQMFYQNFGEFSNPTKGNTEKLLVRIDNLNTHCLNPISSTSIQPALPLNSASFISTSTFSIQQQSSILNEIACYGGQIEKLFLGIRSCKIKRPEIKTPFITPRTTLQKRIAEIWASILGLDRVGIYDSFFELGGDSLRSAEMYASLEKLGVPTTLSISFIQNPTVAGLAEAIEDLRAGRKPKLTTALLSLEHEAQLSAHITVEGRELNISNPPKTIFLTGATGYAGAYLLSELMQQTEAHIYCHVRAATTEEAKDRIEHNLKQHELWYEGYSNRLTIVLGDLTEPYLGLLPSQFDQLAIDVDAIFHNGAWVNFVLPYEILKPTNVTGTSTILEFALHGKVKPLHFISTLGVLMSGKYGRDRVLFEDEPLEHSEELPNGYEQTKWVADRMVWLAQKRGVPASIYRLGMLSGRSDTGVYHKLNEFLSAFFKGCVQLGSFPNLETKLEMVPVDYVMKSLVSVAKDAANLGKVYHLNHPNSLNLDEIFNIINQLGYPLRAVPWDIWKKELMSGGPRLRNNALYPFVDFIRGLQSHQTYMPEMDMQNVFKALSSSLTSCPPQAGLLEKYFNYFVQVGFLHAPSCSSLQTEKLELDQKF